MTRDIDDPAWLIIPGTLRDAAQFFQEELSHPQFGLAAREFLQAQGVTRVTASTFSLGYGGLLLDISEHLSRDHKSLEMAGLTYRSVFGEALCHFAKQAVFPLHDADWKVVGFVACPLAEPVTYATSPETRYFSKRSHLYAFCSSRHVIPRTGDVILVEHVLDALLLHQAGLCNVVATLEPTLSARQYMMLSRVAGRVLIAFDGTPAAALAAQEIHRSAPLLAGQFLPGVTPAALHFVPLPENASPARLIREQGADTFRRCLSQARPLASTN